MKKCSIEGCEKAVLGRGWCAMHYRRWKKHGDPNTLLQKQVHGVTAFERFIPNVTFGDGCWEWSAGRDPNGYGRIRVDDMPALAHRLSYEFAHGVRLTPAQHVLHKCDNPSCVRPSHLMMGDHAANMADKMAKGRHVYGVVTGESHGCAKLTEAEVLAIRASTETGVHLAKAYGVSTTQISDIRNRRVWKHLD
jgi:hypothetical protein